MLDPARPHPGGPGATGDLSRPAGRAHAWVQRIHAVLFHQGAPALGEGTLRSEQGLAALRAAAAAHLSPAGQLQVATALDMDSDHEDYSFHYHFDVLVVQLYDKSTINVQRGKRRDTRAPR
jgi:hypothetical protein